ncbi:hypothetical protein ACFX15_040005 [Malus domestica]
MKWKSASGVLCDRCMPLKFKGKFYRTAIRPAMLYGTECWAVKHQHVHKMGVAEMRMRRWMCGHTRKDKIRNEDIRGKVGVAEIEGKLRENRLRWFGHVQRRPTDAPVRRCDYGTKVQGRRGRGRPRKTLEETLRKDLEYLDLTEDRTQDRAQWRSKIHIANPTQRFMATTAAVISFFITESPTVRGPVGDKNDGRHMLSGEGVAASSTRFKSKRRSEGPDIFKGVEEKRGQTNQDLRNARRELLLVEIQVCFGT